MLTETQAFDKLKKYLVDLGYPKASIVPQYFTRDSQVDAVVQVEDRTLIAIEIKTQLGKQPIPEDQISYHPITRQLQKVASDLGAQIYIVSDGTEHLWLKTGVTGRPERIVEVRNGASGIQLSEVEFTKGLLSHVAELLRNFPLTADSTFDFSLVLYYAVLVQIADTEQAEAALDEIINTNQLSGPGQDKNAAKETFATVADRLSNTDLLTNRIAVLEFIDSFLASSNRWDWDVPRWLAGFMIEVIGLSKSSFLLDYNARAGTVASSAYLKGYNNILSWCQKKEELYWVRLQHILGSKNLRQDVHQGYLLANYSEYTFSREFDGILLAPPFNIKVHNYTGSYLSSGGERDGNALFIESAVNMLREGGRAVIILPDTFLVSVRYQRLREHFSRFIEAIISLPIDKAGTFASVKTSLVIFSRANNEGKGVFLGTVNLSPNESSLQNEGKYLVEKVIDNLKHFRTGNHFDESDSGFIIRNLSSENYHFSKYWLEKFGDYSNSLEAGFTAVPLRQLVTIIERGSQLVSDTVGDIAFINPGSIRPLQLLPDYFGVTSTGKLPSGRIKLTEKDDILMNAIGDYRGSACLVSQKFNGMPVNRHVIIIKPNVQYILPAYLASVLNSDFVQQQFRQKSTGAVIPALRPITFEDIIIPVPSKEEQERFADEYLGIVHHLQSLKIEVNQLESELSAKLKSLGKGGARS